VSRLLGGCLLVVALGASCSSAAARAEAVLPSASQALATSRALEIDALIQRYFYRATTRSYAGTYPPVGRGEAQVWPYSQAVEATVALARLPLRRRPLAELHRQIDRLAAYRAPLRGLFGYAPIYGGHGNVFYDDNVWVGIELVQASWLLRDPAALVHAERILGLIETGWDGGASSCPGGVYWLMPGGLYWDHSVRNRYRTAVSTANAALLAALIYQHTHLAADLRFAERGYAWTERCLGERDGLVGDHIDASGTVVAALHSYNEGAMVALALRLYRATRQPGYLHAALRTARAALARFGRALGTGEPASFMAIFYGDLFPLIGLPGGQAIRGDLASFAERAWLDERDPVTGLFQFGHTKATLLDQAAMVQIYAELARSPAGPVGAAPLRRAARRSALRALRTGRSARAASSPRR
jgi:hypothetical protein